MKRIFLIPIICLFTGNAYSQMSLAPHIDFSATHLKPGGGIDIGYAIGNSYVGINTHVLFTNQRDVPKYVNVLYGYSIGQIQPFISYGFYTCGEEAVKDGEGKQGYAPGGGIAYYPSEKLKITAGTMGNNIFFSISANIVFQ